MGEKSKSDLMIHMDEEHNEHEELMNRNAWPTLEQGKECFNGEDCKFLRQNRCKFVHGRRTDVKTHNENKHSVRGKQEEVPLCRNGPDCRWRRNGACKFTHHEGRSHGG